MISASIETASGVVEVRCTGRAEGDFGAARGDTTSVADRRASIQPLPWTWFRQVHGTDVLEVTHAGQHAGAAGDGAWTREADCPISVTTADCAPVVLVSGTGVALVHAGWRGAADGIVERAAHLLLADGSEPVASFLGPAITPGGYEFGAATLDEIADRYGGGVRATTTDGTPALDMTALIGAACRSAGFPAPDRTACTTSDDYYSHRTRRDLERQATVVWLRTDRAQ